MADNVHRKSHKLSDGSNRKANPIHRTTTETIRLGELERPHQPIANFSNPSNINTTNQCNRKKPSSFQITSVTVGCRMSNDAGEDSNDDLDESHTEDNSIEHSRITDIDIETPSYSEDTFSKEDVFFNTSNAALSTAPVIPTSSQYGLAIVPSEGNNVSNLVNDSNINTLDITSVTDNNIINLLSSNAKQDADLREVHSHGRNERFKVVKIESTEPFKRGRWTCMDYLDHTSVNQSTVINTSKVSDPNEVCISYGITDSGIVIQDAEDKTIDSNGPVSHSDVHPNYTVNNSQYYQTCQQSPQTGPGSTLSSSLQSNHPNNLGQSIPQSSIPINQQTNPQEDYGGQSQSLNILVGQHQQQLQNQINQISESLTPMQGIQGVQNIHASNNVVTGIQQPSMTFHQTDTEKDSIPGIVHTTTTTTTQSAADATLLDSLVEVTQGGDEHTVEDNESVSGTSAVAIDNKIEQAMDLVKSHLMFAVREEVEVLKEKIAELMDRINQLEAENSILKAHATTETLTQLSQATKLPQNNSASGQ